MMIHKLITTFFGLGYMPKASGTFGALGAIVIYYFLLLLGLPSVHFNSILVVLIVVFYFIGVYSTNKVTEEWGKDPSKVVIDETVGQWITLLFIPANHWYILAGFVLFRFFDISKILGIKKAEALPGGTGVMMDDVLAGIYGAVVLQIIIKFDLFFINQIG